MYKKNISLVILAGLFYVSAFAQGFQLADEISFFKDGRELVNPYAGGMNAPIWSQGDIDFDGVDDLMVYDRSGDVWQVFNYGGSGTEWLYNESLSKSIPIPDDWALLRDYDNDGVMDLFGGDVVGGIFGMQIYKGIRNGNRTKWELIPQTLGPENVVYYEVEFQDPRQLEILPSDLPSLDDVDSDGDLDLLTFDSNGGFMLYLENQQVERGLDPSEIIYKLEDECWGKFFESGTADASVSLSSDPNSCFSGLIEDRVEIRHAGSTSSTLDYNRDGLIDILIGDIANDDMVYMQNGGSVDNAWMNFASQEFPNAEDKIFISSFPAAYIIDVDMDGQDDIIVSPSTGNSGENINVAKYYRTTSTSGEWNSELVQRNFLVETMIDGSTFSAPAVADVNADGLLDIIVGQAGPYTPSGENTARLNLWLNTGSSDKPEYTLDTDDYLGFSAINLFNFSPIPAFGDLDNDGDTDMVLGTNGGRLIYFENTAGAGNSFDFKSPVYNYMEIDAGTDAAPIIYDLDGDGLSDIVMGQQRANSADGITACSQLTFYGNIGTVGNPMFEDEEEAPVNNQCLGNALVNEPPSTRGNLVPALMDTGEKKYIIAGSRAGGIHVFGNVEDGLEVDYEMLSDDWGGIIAGDRTSVAIAELDGDGLFELIVGNSRGGIKIYNTTSSLTELVDNDEVDSEIELTITPNPVSSSFMVQSESVINDIEVFTISGQSVLKSQNQSVVECQSLSSGIYIVKVSTENGVVSKRVVKL